MRKVLLAILALVIVAAAGWTGLWFYGKGRIVEEIETQARLMRARGGEATYDAVEVGGYPFGYTGRIVAPKASTAREVTLPETGETVVERYTWSAPWIEARATVTAPDTVTFVFPDTQEVIVDMPQGGPPLPVALVSDGLTVITTREGDDILFDGGARSAGGSFSRETEQAGAVDVVYTLRAFDISGRTKAEQTDGQAPKLALAYTLEGMDGTVTVAGADGQPGGTIGFGSGAVEGSVDSLGRETTGAARIDALAATLAFGQLGNEPLDIGVGRIAMTTRIPREGAPEPQPFGYRVEIADVTLADLLWTLVDPASAFEREIEALTVDIEGSAIFTVAPSNVEAFSDAMESGMPMDLTTLRINDITLDALGATAKATGEAAFETAPPTAKATLAVDGFAGLMNGLVKNGRIPPQQALVVQLMVESFAKTEENSETIRFDFETRDGMMYVNDIPVGEAPALPR